MSSNILKRPHPHDFQEDDDDFDYLINQSIENDKENDIMKLDEYINNKATTTSKPGKKKRASK